MIPYIFRSILGNGLRSPLRAPSVPGNGLRSPNGVPPIFIGFRWQMANKRKCDGEATRGGRRPFSRSQVNRKRYNCLFFWWQLPIERRFYRFCVTAGVNHSNRVIGFKTNWSTSSSPGPTVEKLDLKSGVSLHHVFLCDL